MKKYISIENSYRIEKFVNPFLYQHPELQTCKYIIQEKIHGTNIRIHFRCCLPIKLGSRNRELGDKDHMGFKETLPNIQPVLNHFQDLVDECGGTLTLYGELFGEGIQKSIDYGKGKKILFFDLVRNDELVSQKMFRNYMSDVIEFTVPVLGYAKNLDEALNWPCEFKSMLSPSGSLAEGVVIKPLYGVHKDSLGRVFYLKKKHPLFKEKSKAPKEKKSISIKPSKLLNYITKGRVEGVVAREGGIDKSQQIGQFIKLITEDAIKDFRKDFPVSTLSKQDTSSAGSIIAGFLKKML